MNKHRLPLIALSLFLLLGCEGEKTPHTFRESAFIMGTIVNVTVVDSDERDASLKIEKAFNEIRRIDKMMGREKPSSDIFKVNAAAGKNPVGVSPETLRVVRKSLPITWMTTGKFNITIGALTGLWNIEKNAKRKFIPSGRQIEEARNLVNLKGLRIEEERGALFLKRRGMALDLGGIAKGYAVDRAVEVLKKAGISGGIVDAGGDLRLFGRKPDGSLWKTGIQHPRRPKKIIAILTLTDTSVITSGDYERYFIRDGVRYHHILDPGTGYPARDCRSVTIVTRDTGYADALGTGVFVLGPEKGLRFINGRKDVEGIIVTRSGEVLVSEGLKGRVKIL